MFFNNDNALFFKWKKALRKGHRSGSEDRMSHAWIHLDRAALKIEKPHHKRNGMEDETSECQSKERLIVTGKNA